MLLLLFACSEEPQKEAAKAEGSDFLRDTTVRIDAPTNGLTVESPLVVAWSAGEDVRRVAVEVDDEEVQAAEVGDGELVLSLDPGRYTLTLVGEDLKDNVLSEHEISIRVAEAGESWVTFVSPSDGEEVANPVRFLLSASEDVSEITLLADGWELGRVAPGDVLTYEFTGTGYERSIEAVAGSAVDAISLTVTPESAPEESDYNEVVLRYLQEYPRDGSHDYYWPDDGDWYGVTQDIYYQGRVVAEGDSQGRCYCCGLTWEVFMRATDEIDRSSGGDGTWNDMDEDDVDTFRVDWFVRELNGAGVVDALENYGLGDAVSNFEDARAGDFVQFWRQSGSGHSVIFDSWLRNNGSIVGVAYWSTQSSTDGIDYNEEYFGTGGSDINPSYFFLARARMPGDWTPWR